MPRPVLFLDVDGVLCTPLSVRLDQVFRRPMDRQFFDPVALFWLQKLVRRTGAQVVLSSSWRYALEDGDLFTGRILQNLYDCLAAHGAPVAGIAPILGVSKGEEIAAWVTDHPPAPYVILDDRADEFAAVPALQPHLVLVDSRHHSEAKSGRTAVVLALEGIFGVTANDLYGKFRRIIFCHTLQHGFQNNALWAIGNVFFCRHHPHAILFQDSLIMGTVIAIAGKTVQLPDHNHIKQPLSAVFNHSLEIGALIRLGRKGTVNIFLYDSHPIPAAIFHAFPDLSVDAFLALVVRGVAGIDYSIHIATPLLVSIFRKHLQHRFFHAVVVGRLGVKAHLNELLHLSTIFPHLWLIVV